MKNTKGFTIAEVLMASVIALFIALGAWAVFTSGQSWWQETLQWVDTQRIARIAMNSVLYGVVDNTLGTDGIGGATYQRRTGILWASDWTMADAHPTIANAFRTLNITLDGGNNETYSFGVDGASGLNALLYNGAVIDETVGLTDLYFEKALDANGTAADDLIRVTSRAARTLQGTRPGGYTADVQLQEVVCLRNY